MECPFKGIELKCAVLCTLVKANVERLGPRALTPRVAPARDPAVVSRLQAGLLARQAGVADKVGRQDVCAGFHQGDVVVQLAVRGVAEVLVAVDALHGDHSLGDLGAFELVLPQDDPPAGRVLCLTPGR